MMGKRLFDLRKDAGLTQDALSAIIHVNKHSISSYERDKSEAPDEIKIRIAKFFGVSVDYLLGMTDNPSPCGQERNYIRLPVNFPEQAMENLQEYANFLIQKYKP